MLPFYFEYQSEVTTSTRYQEEFEMKMYFMITELLNNIMKHSYTNQMTYYNSKCNRANDYSD
jgi:glucose-6-phosphate-specific signal transduction histidine kinase